MFWCTNDVEKNLRWWRCYMALLWKHCPDGTHHTRIILFAAKALWRHQMCIPATYGLWVSYHTLLWGYVYFIYFFLLWLLLPLLLFACIVLVCLRCDCVSCQSHVCCLIKFFVNIQILSLFIKSEKFFFSFIFPSLLVFFRHILASSYFVAIWNTYTYRAYISINRQRVAIVTWTTRNSCAHEKAKKHSANTFNRNDNAKSQTIIFRCVLLNAGVATAQRE